MRDMDRSALIAQLRKQLQEAIDGCDHKHAVKTTRTIQQGVNEVLYDCPVCGEVWITHEGV